MKPRRRWRAIAVLILATAMGGVGSPGPLPAHETHAGDELAPAPSAFPGLSVYQLESVWRDDRDLPFPITALRGRPAVLVMVYTSCEYVCPVLVEDVKRIEAALGGEQRDAVRFVLVSFDPARDSPAALAAYRVKRDLDASRWVLLTGDPDDVLALAAVLGVRFRPDGKGDFAHSNLITVLDAEGVVRHQQVGIGRNREATTEAVRTLIEP